MKKITLFLFTLLLFNLNSAQTVVWSDNFDDLDISDWTLSDEDGDGFDWSAVQIQDNMMNPVGTPLLRSASWNGAVGPLNPNNWAISPVIDLTNASGTITLDWQIMAIDASYDLENYTVYVATSNVIGDLQMSTTSFNEPSLDGVNTLTDRSLDISSFAGQSTVYVAFRHHNVSDQFTLEVDNVSVSAATILSTEESELNNFNYLYNTKDNLLTLESADTPFDVIQVYNILGKEVINEKLSKTDEIINMNALADGVYVIRVTIRNQSRTIKIIKN